MTTKIAILSDDQVRKIKESFKKAAKSNKKTTKREPKSYETVSKMDEKGEKVAIRDWLDDSLQVQTIQGITIK